MYGRLEDETSFSSVRQLIGQEDYALRLLDDQGFDVAHTYGIVELTPNQRVPARRAVLRRRRHPRSRHGRRRDRRPGDAARPAPVGLGPGASRSEAGEHARRRRAPAGDRRVRARGPPVAVAPGGRPREHDAGDGAAHRRAAGLRRRAPVLHARGRRRGVRRRAGHGDPDRAPALPEGGSTRSARRVPSARPAAPADLDPTVELTADRPHGRRSWAARSCSTVWSLAVFFTCSTERRGSRFAGRGSRAGGPSPPSSR